MNLRRLIIAALPLTGLAAALTVAPAEAGTKDYTCPSGYKMKGSVASGSVHCYKAGSETLRGNYPVCGIRRYDEDREGNTDVCTKTNGKKTGYPKCIGGTKSVRKGKDRCVNKTPAKTKPSVRCPSGYTMKGSTSSHGGRGSVHCYKPPTETLRSNYPVCGIRRYDEDREGFTDVCTKTNGTKTGYPNCIGGTKSVRKGKDRCVNKTPGKTVKPS